MTHLLSCSIVVYKNDPEILAKAINSVLNSSINSVLYIYDNSPTPELKALCADHRIKYIHNPSNDGFGKGHNFCIQDSLNQSKYHLILNPDVSFEYNVLEHLVNKLEEDKTIGVISPKILYPNGQIQFSCRQLPSPFDMLVRRVGFLSKIYADRLSAKDLEFTGYNKTMEVPFLLGCFLLIPTRVLKETGSFDETFFMYMEDFDLVRRIKKKYKTLFCPEVFIYHVYERGSGKNLKLIQYHIISAIKYFNKWGWFFDTDRRNFNKDIIKKFENDLMERAPK